VHRGVWVVVGGGITVFAAAAGLLAGKILFDDRQVVTEQDSRPTAEVITLPQVSAETAAATLSYLDDDGQVLVEITGTVDRLRSTVRGADPEGCRAMTVDLGDRYPVDTVLDRLQAMPDPFLGEWLSTYWGSAFGALDACVQRESAADFLGDAGTALEQVDKRIAQLKDAR
jgi:hypothetical protein